MKRFECLESGCEFVVDRDDDDELVAAVQRHMSEAHDSFEIDEVILTNALVVPDAATRSREGSAAE